MSESESLRNTNALIAFNQFARERIAFGEPGNGAKPVDRGFSDHFPVTVRLSVAP